MNEIQPLDWSGKTIAIVGGSGFLGGLCGRHFAALGAGVVVISRRRPTWMDAFPSGTCQWLDWSAAEADWTAAMEGASAVINFVGRTVNCRKTPSHCDQILRSRVDSVRKLGRVLASVAKHPPVWVQAGTAHIYGDPPEERIGDDGAPGWGLAPFVGKEWERAFHESLPDKMRGVILRTSFVLDAREGPLPVLARLARFGLGGKAGHGRQGFSWIHGQDFASIVERSLTDESIQGPINVTAPEPVSQAEFMVALRRVLRIPVGLPAPDFAVRLGATWILNTDPELVLEGRYVLPTRLLGMGFDFQYPKITAALEDLLCKKTLMEHQRVRTDDLHSAIVSLKLQMGPIAKGVQN